MIANSVRNLIEKGAFGILSSLGARIGISSSRIRLYFIYTSCLTLGSPVLLYLIAIFWMNIKTYQWEKRRSLWDI